MSFCSLPVSALVSAKHLRDMIHSICATLNETGKEHDKVAGSYLVGSGLAMDLLEDGLSRHQPKFVHSLARIAIRALDVPNDDFQIQLANVYEDQLQPIYAEELARRLRDKKESVRLGNMELFDTPSGSGCRMGRTTG